MKYKPVIGLEIHAELNTQTKMFCDSLNDPDETRPNVNVCPICLAHPGTLPVINIEAVNKVIKVGLALGAEVNELSWFERKNYFYPDLPKGYQISQYEKPFCEGGVLTLASGKEVRIKRVHLEEDTGKLIHGSPSTSSGQPASLVDFNRAGVPLMELVTEPDIESGRAAKEFGEELQLLFRYLDVSGAEMEKGQLRVEANISLTDQKSNLKPARPAGGSQKLGTKVEIKNLNSFRACERAIDYEIKRQTELLEQGQEIIQETRGWNESEGVTFSQRQKEESHDYRYFPEPDLPPVRIEKTQVEYLKAELPELPARRRERFVSEYGITVQDAQVFTVQKELGDFFEKTASELGGWAEDAGELESKEKVWKLIANYLITEIQKLLSIAGQNISDIKITPEDFSELMVLIYKNTISSSAAQTILKEMFETGADPNHVIESKNLTQLSGSAELKKAAQEVISQNPQPVADYKKGKTESLKFLVGQLMRATGGRANPQVGEEIIKELLK